MINLNHLVGDLIDQVAVVGDQADGSLKLLQSHFQDISRRDIEMAGGFVEEKKVGRFEKHLCQDQPTLLAPTQNRDLFFNLLSTEEKGSQEGSKLCLGFIGGDGESSSKTVFSGLRRSNWCWAK